MISKEIFGVRVKIRNRSQSNKSFYSDPNSCWTSMNLMHNKFVQSPPCRGRWWYSHKTAYVKADGVKEEIKWS